MRMGKETDKEGGKKGERERGDKILHSLVHSLNSCKGQGWSRPEPGTCNCILISHRDGRGPRTWAFCCCFPRHTGRELDQKSSSWDSALQYGERVIQAVDKGAESQSQLHKLLENRVFSVFCTYMLSDPFI